METWVKESLCEILGFPTTPELIQYVMQIQNHQSLEKNLLDSTNPKHRQFIAELKKRLASSNDQIGYKKVNDADNISLNEKKKGKSKTKKNQKSKQVPEVVKVEKVEKKKPKFVNLYSQEGKDRATVLLKGRHKCDCEAKKHALINNCFNCGRIVCIQEGAGPCFFCGEIVCSTQDQIILSSNTKQSDALYNKLINQKLNDNLEDTIKQRNKLLEYDRDGVQCTKVIDDECDYYQLDNIWLSNEKRKKLEKLQEISDRKKHMSRLNRKVNVTIDFAGREIIEESPDDNFTEFAEEYLQDIPKLIRETESNNICPHIEFDHLMYIDSDEPKTRTSIRNALSNTKTIVQDEGYLAMSDPGLCLSMHQPYASLLVSGIKIHEGRTWYSSHRGKLWIAATSKTPSKEEISNIEYRYRILKDEKLKFPETYPTSCLLGFVTVIDVLPQEEYRKSYPEGEIGSPYVFICENFCALPIKIPVQGKHKIYKLDSKIHYAALKILEMK